MTKQHWRRLGLRTETIRRLADGELDMAGAQGPITPVNCTSNPIMCDRSLVDCLTRTTG
ncbi:MAG TPA: hypothetical protein VG245_00655 [Candidatus Dormibacteraeota bacterium]|jgi:hypothetical protein|nr:hypothetical protein [Candidatus Dormibacteraeota bacterium]